MIQVLFYTGSVIVAWGFMFAVFAGAGLLVRRLFGGRAPNVDAVLLAPWLGWAAGIGYLQVWHLFLPVNAWAWAMPLAAAGAGWLLTVRVLRRRPSWSRLVLGLLGAGGMALWLTGYALRQPDIYDSGLYHLNAVRWASEYAIVPGLGNLHDRLAFNNAHFLYMALLDVGPFTGRSHHLGAGFLVLISLLRNGAGVVRMVRCARHRGRCAEVTDIYHALLFAPVVVWLATSGYVSSPSPDVGVFLLGLVIAGELMVLLFEPELSARRIRVGVLSIVLLACVGIAVKLSFIVFGGLACMVGWGVMTGRNIPRSKVDVPMVTTAGCLMVLILGVWMGRGIALSGYPAFPATVGGIDVDWRVSAGRAEAVARWALSWARIPGEEPDVVLADWMWVRPWAARMWKDHMFDTIVPVCLALLGVTFRFVGRRGEQDAFPKRRLGLFLAVPLGGLLFWFFTAPDPRFAAFAFWSLACGVSAFGLLAQSSCFRIVFLGVYTAGLLLCNLSSRDWVRTWRDTRPARTVEMQPFVTNSGLEILVPAEGEQAWDAALPAAPRGSKALRLRVPGDMSRGFTRRPTP